MIRDLIIIGAGLAGSSLAAAISRLGYDVLLLERRAFPHHKVCGEFLSPEAQASLYALGLYDSVAGLAPARISQARLIGHAGTALQLDLPAEAWGVSRYTLDAALADAARQAGAELRIASASAVQAAGTGWRVSLRDAQGQHELAARAVVIACGRHAPIGLRAAGHTGATGTAVGVKCHYAGIEMPAHVELYMFPGGYAGINRIENGLANLCLLASREAFARAGSQIQPMLQAACQANPTLARRMHAAQPVPSSAVAVAAVNTNAAPVPADQLVRLGDAATMIPPLCGDGMAMALRAAEICVPLAADFLAGRSSHAQWLESYRRAWQHEFAARIRTGRQLQWLLGMPVLSDGLLGLGKLLPAAAAHFVHATRGRPRPLEQVLRLSEHN